MFLGTLRLLVVFQCSISIKNSQPSTNKEEKKWHIKASENYILSTLKWNGSVASILLYIREVLTQLLLHAGKTLLAKAVANQTSATFLRVVGSELIQKYLGDGPKLVRELFRVAEEHAPSIVFIDEIDAIGTKRYFKLLLKWCEAQSASAGRWRVSVGVSEMTRCEKL